MVVTDDCCICNSNTKTRFVLRVRAFFHFIQSVQFPRLWKYVKMDYGQIVQGKFFVLVETSSLIDHIALHPHYLWSPWVSCHQKERIERTSFFFFKLREHRTSTFILSRQHCSVSFHFHLDGWASFLIPNPVLINSCFQPEVLDKAYLATPCPSNFDDFLSHPAAGLFK